ncbi:UNVERIFIED_ORG: rare lipoprotein A [Idiomarina abyssalis]|jgi:rare lipoprotein A|uniref:Endolytic peptidoglycan transglycosylase RlpA n=1 Tax=Idiomarina loihiensis (strain ATCC BAA-735 / DSM 15497 / L2-TR) TaxID=283942 RepID=Q5QX96_IDILO|nr:MULTISPECIES: septal ring lytic transglycosylase RlpA family protein [Idiomarina]AAV82597.1 Lipoprotein A family protein [Idiomarina loihiensis L2TR]AGM36638.1 lipoprotein [Idiomarina loihiensis GSL 199]PHQ91322.1 MAG: septal ring lytic transglycosylase RlpA family lipoprotein [Idiomarina sp.]TDO49468.1 rare lipoprotein A [Idiomarina sp. 017G]
MKTKNQYPLKQLTLGVGIFMLALTGCTSIPAESPQNVVGTRESGKASYYAMKYQFRTTASGETYNHFSSTAAHRTLPFGTKVRVTNIANNKSVVVKINDRGPFIDGRVIDLSRSAFDKIADLDSGVIEVATEVVD